MKKHVRLLVDGSMDYFLILCLIIYAANYYFGIKRNQTIAKDWLHKVKGLVFDNFAVIGTDKTQLESSD